MEKPIIFAHFTESFKGEAVTYDYQQTPPAPPTPKKNRHTSHLYKQTHTHTHLFSFDVQTYNTIQLFLTSIHITAGKYKIFKINSKGPAGLVDSHENKCSNKKTNNNKKKT